MQAACRDWITWRPLAGVGIYTDKARDRARHYAHFYGSVIAPSGQRAARENAAREVRLLLQHVVAGAPEKQGEGAGPRLAQHVVAIRAVRTVAAIRSLRDTTPIERAEARARPVFRGQNE